MVDRRPAPRREPQADTSFSDIGKYRSGLAIDRDDINDEVCKHAEEFEHVGDQVALANARVDSAKYALEVEEARVGKRVREEAYKAERKPTDKAVAEVILLDDDIQEKQMALIAAKAEAAQWAAVKEAWQQRSYMLKECVSIYLARMNSSSSVTAPRDALADGMREGTARLREERGYRPRGGRS